MLYIDNSISKVHLDDYYELFFSRQPTTQWPLPPSTINQSKKVTKIKQNQYKDPESKENIEKFINEIQSLGRSSTSLSDENTSTNSIYDTNNNEKYNNILINSISNRRIEKLEKSSWKRSIRKSVK